MRTAHRSVAHPAPGCGSLSTAGLLAGEFALSHRARPRGAHHEHPSRRCSPAFRPLHGCQASRLAVSGAARVRVGLSAGPPTCESSSGIPRKIRIVTAVTAFSAPRAPRVPPLRHAHGRIEAPTGNPSHCCSQPTAAAGRRTTRSRSRQQRRRAHRRVGAPSATWALSALSRGAHTPFRGTVDAVPSATVVCQASSRQATRGHSGRNFVTAPNSLRALRQIDSKKPPRYTRRLRIGPLPGGFLFPEWVAFFTGIRNK